MKKKDTKGVLEGYQMGSQGAPPTLAEDAGLSVETRPQALLRLVNQNGDAVGVPRHCAGFPLAPVHPCARSHLRLFPLTPVPTCSRSHLRPFPDAPVPNYARSHLLPFPLAPVPTCSRS